MIVVLKVIVSLGVHRSFLYQVVFREEVITPDCYLFIRVEFLYKKLKTVLIEV
jgi:hypothetical protein